MQSQARPPVTKARSTHSHWHLSQTLDLLFMITAREIMIRYKQSIMGFFWALLMPALVVAAGLMVRAAVAQLSGRPLETSAMTAILVKSLPWAFFVSAIRSATSSLTTNSNLVTRARCPRVVFPLSSILSALFDFAVALAALVIALAIVKVPVTLQLLWVVPLMLLLIALACGLGLGLATANLFYRDVKYIVEVVLMFAIFFTPVLYETAMLGSWKRFIMLNPVAPVLEGLYSAVALGQPPELGWLAYSAAVTVTIAALSWLLFRRLEPAFADNI
jgi:lipopolysaccharide transport system permease protein